MSHDYPVPSATWPEPNYVDPKSRGHTLTIVSSILVFAAGVFVGLRYWAHYLNKRWGPDDICIMIAWLMTVGTVVADDISTQKYGWNRHVWDVPWSWIHKVGLWSWIAKLFYTTAACFTRLSILAFYYRLIEGATWSNSYRRILHTALAGIIILYLVTLFLAIFMCIPVEAYWDDRYATNCRSESRELFATSAASCVCDAIIVCLPIPIVWRLRMSVQKRLQVIALLAVGLIATASSCVRTYYVWRMFHSGYDTSWEAYPIYFTTDLEIIIGIMCACTPHIKPLVQQWFGCPDVDARQRQFAEDRAEKHKAALSPDVESLDFITQAPTQH